MERTQIFNKEVIDRFALQVKKIRKEKGYTQEALAFHSGIALSQIARMETGKINPTLSTIDALATGLKIPLRSIFDFQSQTF